MLVIEDIHDKYLSRETEVPLEAARGFWLPLVFERKSSRYALSFSAGLCMEQNQTFAGNQRGYRETGECQKINMPRT